MKKFLGLFLAIVTAFILVGSVNAIEKPKVTDHEKINVYIFRGSGCSHCYDALTYLYGLNGEYDDYFNVITYEVWGNSVNAGLAKAVASKLGDEFGGVPYIVIGKKSFAGFGSSTGTDIIETALEAYKDKKYKDVVASVIKSGKYNDAVSQTLAEAAYEEGVTGNVPQQTQEEKPKDDTLVILAVFVVIVGGFGALIYSSRKK